MVINHVRENFKQILNVCLFTEKGRRDAVKRLYDSCSSIFQMRLGMLDPAASKDENKMNEIEVIRASEEEKPVLSAFTDYVNIRERRLEKNKRDLTAHNLELITMTVKELSVYHSKTKRFYPYITPKDVFFNQQTNKVELDPKKIILE